MIENLEVLKYTKWWQNLEILKSLITEKWWQNLESPLSRSIGVQFFVDFHCGAAIPMRFHELPLRRPW